MTLLLQDQCGGLQVLNRSTDQWIEVQPVPDAFLVNIGDLMMRWTNNRYKSTMHRVISKPHGKSRYSCAYFCEGQLDRVVECLPTCLAPGDKPKYEPIRAEDHYIKRYVQSYGAAGTELKGY